MRVKFLNECGYHEAMLGLSLSHKRPVEEMFELAVTLADKDGGHNKFLESIWTWWDITAPRYWWQQFDTYRVGVSKQSESTMHTVTKQPLTQADFEDDIPEGTLTRINWLIQNKQFFSLKNELPEGFLQRRIVNINYKSLRNILIQRRTHRLSQLWGCFCDEVIRQTIHSELLPK